MSYIICSPQVASLLNLKSTYIPEEDDNNAQKSNFMDKQAEIARDFMQNAFFNYEATEYFGEY